MKEARRRATIALSLILTVLGVVVLVQTALVGGELGFLLGGLLLLAGVLRIVVMKAA